VDRYGLSVGELEVLVPLGNEPDQHEAFAIGLARDLRCPVIQLNGPFEGTIAEGAQRLRALVDRSVDSDITFSLEFLPWTNVPTAAIGAQLVAAVDRPNVGICVDAWHLYRSGGKVDDLAGLWPFVTSIQLDDGPVLSDRPDDLREDCVHNRRLPGSGEFDLVGLLSGAERNAPDCSLSLEVMSDELKARPLDEVAALLASSTIATFAAVREAVDG
jgi:sugar phosphate isomerase/epimerase